MGNKLPSRKHKQAGVATTVIPDKVNFNPKLTRINKRGQLILIKEKFTNKI